MIDDDSRKHPVHWPAYERDNLSIIIFVTVCTEKRRKILADAASVEVILDAWRAADHWLVGRYVILPDHIHLFLFPRPSWRSCGKAVDRILEKPSVQSLAAPRAAPDLAD